MSVRLTMVAVNNNAKTCQAPSNVHVLVDINSPLIKRLAMVGTEKVSF